MEVKEILEGSSSFDKDVFTKLLVRYDTPHIFLTETTNLIKSMEIDYPEIVSIQSIGKSWQDRDINMIKIDALEFM